MTTKCNNTGPAQELLAAISSATTASGQAQASANASARSGGYSTVFLGAMGATKSRYFNDAESSCKTYVLVYEDSQDEIWQTLFDYIGDFKVRKVDQREIHVSISNEELGTMLMLKFDCTFSETDYMDWLHPRRNVMR